MLRILRLFFNGGKENTELPEGAGGQPKESPKEHRQRRVAPSTEGHIHVSYGERPGSSTAHNASHANFPTGRAVESQPDPSKKKAAAEEVPIFKNTDSGKKGTIRKPKSSRGSNASTKAISDTEHMNLGHSSAGWGRGVPEVHGKLEDDPTHATSLPDLTAKRIAASEARARFLNTVNTLSEIDSRFMESLSRQMNGDETISIDLLRQDFQILEKLRADLKIEQEDCRRRERAIIRAEHGLVEDSSVVSAADSDPKVVSWHEDEGNPQGDRASLQFQILSDRDRYLSQIGNVDLLREKIESMEIEYARVLQDKEMLDIIGQSLDPPDLEFFETFESERQILASHLEEAKLMELDLKYAQSGVDVRLSNQNAAHRILKECESPSTHSLFWRDHYFHEYPDSDLLIENAEGAAAAQRLLVPHKQRLPVYGEVIDAHNGESVDKTSYIDAWLLHRAQTVPTEAARLMDAHLKRGSPIHADEHKDLVLTHWHSDGEEQAQRIQNHEARSHDTSTAPNNSFEAEL